MVYEVLREGKENATCSATLRVKLGLGPRQLRKQIERERRSGKIILSNTESGGYYRPGSRAEVAEFVKSMERRGANTFAVIKAARAVLDEFPGQEVITGIDESEGN